jgi:hypothetical protein
LDEKRVFLYFYFYFLVNVNSVHRCGVQVPSVLVSILL